MHVNGKGGSTKNWYRFLEEVGNTKPSMCIRVKWGKNVLLLLETGMLRTPLRLGHDGCTPTTESCPALIHNKSGPERALHFIMNSHR